MTARFALWLPMVMLALLALLTFWIDQSVKQAGSRGGANLSEPDSIVENFLAVSTDATGELRYRLTADKLSHFSNDKLTLLDQPRLTHFHEKQGEMQISSSRANVTPDGSRVVFSGQVSLLRPAGSAGKELSMRTTQLEILTEKNEAITEQPVLIQQPGLQINATGLHLFADTRVLKLKGRVKALFQNAKRA
jgi:lipopolysaccharide export system protein LptC